MLQNTWTCAEEFNLFKACLSWAKERQKKGDKREVNEILSNIGNWIRYPFLTADELIKTVKPTGVCPYPLYKNALEHIVGPDYTDKELLKDLQFQAVFSIQLNFF
jgi:hypothetical protein